MLLSGILYDHSPVEIMGDSEMRSRTMLRCHCDRVWRTPLIHAQHVVDAIAADAIEKEGGD